MRYLNVESTASPQSVTVERCPDRTIVRLADNVRTEQKDEQDVYIYDEVVFDLPVGRSADPADIAEDFAAWWSYGQENHEPPTDAERLDALEDAVESIVELLM